MSAYLLSIVEVTQITDDFKRYVAASAALLKQFGGEYMLRGKASQVYEGTALEGKSVVLTRFADMDRLKAFYQSDEYQQKVKPLRANTGIYDIASFEAP